MALIFDQLELNLNGKTLCHAVCAKLESGQIWGILGQNGVGKSRFLHALAGLIPFNKGKVSWNDTDLLQLSNKARAKVLSLLPQYQNYFFPCSVTELIASGRYPHRNQFGIKNQHDQIIIETLTTEFDLIHLRHKNILELSGGEQQRTAIAAVIAQDTKILLFDEPCNHLDLRHQKQILSKFIQLAQNQKKIIIMVLHDLNLIQQYCDQLLLFFDHGKVLAGKSKDLMTSQNLTALYHHPIKQCTTSDGKKYFSY